MLMMVWIRGFAFGELCDGEVPQIVEPKAGESSGGAFLGSDGGSKTARSEVKS